MRRCPAVTIDEYGRCRCDERRGHLGEHRAERGMYDVVWSPENHTSAPAHAALNNGARERRAESNENGRGEA